MSPEKFVRLMFGSGDPSYYQIIFGTNQDLHPDLWIMVSNWLMIFGKKQRCLLEHRKLSAI